MKSLAAQAFSPEALRRAWGEVRDNDAADGELGPGVRRFEAEEDERLERLVADLAWGAYKPDILTEVVITRDAAERRLHIPSVRDRIVARAVMRGDHAVCRSSPGPSQLRLSARLGSGRRSAGARAVA